MHSPLFENYSDCFDEPLFSCSSELFALRSNYLELAQNLLESLGETETTLDTTVAVNLRGRFELKKVSAVAHNADEKRLYLVLDDGSLLSMSDISTDSQDMIVSMLHIEFKTRIIKERLG